MSMWIWILVAAVVVFSAWFVVRRRALPRTGGGTGGGLPGGGKPGDGLADVE